MSEKIETHKNMGVPKAPPKAPWKEYDAAAKLIEKQKDELLDTVEERLKQTIEEKVLFTIRWSVV
jgi:hypothetical protein